MFLRHHVNASYNLIAPFLWISSFLTTTLSVLSQLVRLYLPATCHVYVTLIGRTARLSPCFDISAHPCLVCGGVEALSNPPALLVCTWRQAFKSSSCSYLPASIFLFHHISELSVSTSSLTATTYLALSIYSFLSKHPVLSRLSIHSVPSQHQPSYLIASTQFFLSIQPVPSQHQPSSFSTSNKFFKKPPSSFSTSTYFSASTRFSMHPPTISVPSQHLHRFLSASIRFSLSNPPVPSQHPRSFQASTLFLCPLSASRQVSLSIHPILLCLSASTSYLSIKLSQHPPSSLSAFTFLSAKWKQR